eukprot:COSAG01_NODE_3024_length_6708_cov_23.565138_4_plen_143_part_00
MGLFSALGKFGNKVVGAAEKGLRFGQKVLGKVSHVGHKVVDMGQKGVGFVEKMPVLGALAEPVLAPVKSALNLASAGLGVVDSTNRLAGRVQSGVRATQSAVKAGDFHQAANVMRDTARDSYASGKKLKSSARSVLERRKRP